MSTFQTNYDMDGTLPNWNLTAIIVIISENNIWKNGSRFQAG